MKQHILSNSVKFSSNWHLRIFLTEIQNHTRYYSHKENYSAQILRHSCSLQSNSSKNGDIWMPNEKHKNILTNCQLCGDVINEGIGLSRQGVKLRKTFFGDGYIFGRFPYNSRIRQIRNKATWARTLVRHYSNLSDCNQLKGDNPVRSSPPWRVLFFGSDYFANVTLKALNENRLSVDNRIVDDLEVVAPDSVKCEVRQYAKQSGLVTHSWPVVVPDGRYDVGVVVSYGKLIPNRIIQNIPHGILNVHASLLPRWKGAAPIAHTILNDDKVTGVSIMKIRPKHFDTGPVLLQTEVPVPENTTALQLGELLAPLGAKMVIEALTDLVHLENNAIEQSNDGATLAPKLTDCMGYVDFITQGCHEVYRLYRAISDKVPLSCEYMDLKIRLMEMKVADLDDEFYTLIQRYFSKPDNDIPPGSMFSYKRHKLLMVRFKDGWVGFGKIAVKTSKGWKTCVPTDFNHLYISEGDKHCVFTKCDSHS